jgi:cell division protein FtsN
MLRMWLTVILVAALPIVGNAQQGSDSAVYRRAQALVNDGNSVAGRALVDSMIARATPASNEYAEGLYWRAVLSATAVDAEMDYRRIVVDYSTSPRVEDVLLRLAQLELARADYDGALQHLNRLTLEHPTGKTRARAGYWTARVLFEKNDIQRACAANADALSRTSQDDTELWNQISYLNQRCAGVAVAAVSPSDTPASPGSVASVPVMTNPPILPAPAKIDSATSGKSNLSSSVTPAAETPPSAQAPVVGAKPSMKPPAEPRDGKPTMVEPPSKIGIPTEQNSKSAESSSGAGEYTVQIAAYNVKSQAAAMVTKLRKKGYEARVSGSSAPFRVRIGRYATQSQASAVMRSLKGKQIDGFVVKAESR